MMEFLITEREAWPLDALNVDALPFVLDESDACIDARFERATVALPENIVEIIGDEYDFAGDDVWSTLLRPTSDGLGFVAPQGLLERVGGGGESLRGCKWIAAFTGPALPGLQLFRRDHEEELIPLTVPCQNAHSSSRTMVVDLQCVPERLYFSLAFPRTGNNTPYLLLALLAVRSHRREALRLEDYFQAVPAIDGSPNEAFVEESLCRLPAFHPEVAVRLLEVLEQQNPSTHSGQLVGPMDYRHYRRLELANDGLSIDGVSVLSILTSDAFRRLISQMSGLSLSGLSQLEGRRITKGDYQILNDRYTEPHGLDVVISLQRTPAEEVELAQDGGSLLYLVEGEQVASIQPHHNTLSLAYRVEGCNRFMPLLCEIPREGFEIFQFHQTFVVSDQ